MDKQPLNDDEALAMLEQLDTLSLSPLQVEFTDTRLPASLSPQQQELWQWLDEAGYRVANGDDDRE